MRVGSEVALQYYRLDRVHAGAVRVAEGGAAEIFEAVRAGRPDRDFQAP